MFLFEFVELTGWKRYGHLHGDTHGIAEIDDDEGDDGQPLLLCEGCHDGPEASLAATIIKKVKNCLKKGKCKNVLTRGADEDLSEKSKSNWGKNKLEYLQQSSSDAGQVKRKIDALQEQLDKRIKDEKVTFTLSHPTEYEEHTERWGVGTRIGWEGDHEL